MKFENPHNGYIVNTSGADVRMDWFWVLLFGPLFWAIKGVWRHVFVNTALICIIFWICIIFGFGFFLFLYGVLQLIYAVFTYEILRNHYRMSGWKELQD